MSSIPAGSTINSAVLTLTRSSGGTGTNVDVHRVTTSWSETGPTWNAQPTYNAGVEAQRNVTTGANTWTITSLVQGWVSGTYTNNGLAIKAANENDYYIFFYSSDYGTAASRPKLDITYNAPPNSPVPVSPATATVIQKGQTNLFDWTFSDPDGGDSQSAWAFRRTTSGTNYWWNVSTASWQTNEVFNTGGTDSYNFTANTWPSGVHSWSIATKDAGGLASSYSTGRTVTVSAGFKGFGVPI